MKRLNTLILILFISFSSIAQINITLEDYVRDGQLGDTLSYFEAFGITLDMGQMGQTTWDFSDVTMTSKIFVEFVDPSTTPYAGLYPDSKEAMHQVFTGDFAGDTYNYTTRTDTSVFNYGESISDNSSAIHIMFDPASELVFPLSFGSSWVYEGEESVEFDGDLTTNPLTINSNINSYGKLTMPSGKIVDALLLRNHEIRNFDGTLDTSKTFIFFTSDADAIIIFVGLDEPDTGEIQVNDMMWFENSPATSVEDNESLANDYRLKQNYPNPFNPATTIEYSIPEANEVSLKIFDSLGEEVAILVDEFKSAGNYEAEFNAAGLSSGIYFARFKSGDYSSSIKLTLLK